MNQSQIIDLAKAKKEVKLDQDLADMLGIDQSTVSRLRNGRQNFGPELALRVADAAGLDPRDVVAVVMAARSKDEESRKRWEALVEDQLRIMCRKAKRKRHLLPIWYEGEYQEAA